MWKLVESSGQGSIDWKLISDLGIKKKILFEPNLKMMTQRSSQKALRTVLAIRSQDTVYINVLRQKWVIVAQSCLTLYNPMDCSLPGSSVHGILQARLLEWVAISFSLRQKAIHQMMYYWQFTYSRCKHHGGWLYDPLQNQNSVIF